MELMAWAWSSTRIVVQYLFSLLSFDSSRPASPQRSQRSRDTTHALYTPHYQTIWRIRRISLLTSYSTISKTRSSSLRRITIPRIRTTARRWTKRKRKLPIKNWIQILLLSQSVIIIQSMRGMMVPRKTKINKTVNNFFFFYCIIINFLKISSECYCFVPNDDELRRVMNSIQEITTQI